LALNQEIGYNHPMNKILIAGLLLAILVGIALVLTPAPAPDPYLADFFNANITALSPVKSTLGGTFYVTKVEARDGAGTVYYEDGHNGYVADFLYSTDKSGRPKVETFTMHPFR
jgi:hypothetical protein